MTAAPRGWRLATLGAASGAFAVLVPLAAWAWSSARGGTYAALLAQPGVRAAVREELIVAVATGVATGAVLGLLARAVAPRTRGEAILALAALWSSVLLGVLIANPASASFYPGLRDLPIGATAMLLVGLVCGAATRLRARRVAAAAGAILLPFAWPAAPRDVPEAPAGSAGTILLGIDAGGRAVVDSAVAMLAARRPAVLRGGVHFTQVVSTTPLTRIAWLGLLAGRDPIGHGLTQWLADEPRAVVEDRLGMPWTDAARAAGARPVFLTDNAGSFLPSPRAVDTTVTVAAGWRLLVATVVRQRFPLGELLVGRHLGGHASTFPGGGQPWPLWRRALATARPGRPDFIATHVVRLNQPAAPAAWALPAGHAWSLSPSALAAGGAPERLLSGPRERLLAMATLYSLRRHEMIRDVADLLEALEARGWRRGHAIVLFADHGEHFDPIGPGLDSLSPGLHGMVLDPRVVGTSVLVLPPVPDAAAPLVRDDGDLLPLYALRAMAEGRTAPAALAVARQAHLPLQASARTTRSWDPVAEHGLRVHPLESVVSVARYAPDGEFLVPRMVLDSLDAATAVGCASRHGVLALSPLADGRVLEREQAWDGQVRRARIVPGPRPDRDEACIRLVASELSRAADATDGAAPSGSRATPPAAPRSPR